MVDWDYDSINDAYEKDRREGWCFYHGWKCNRGEGKCSDWKEQDKEAAQETGVPTGIERKVK